MEQAKIVGRECEVEEQDLERMLQEYHNIGFYAEVYGGDSVTTASQRATYQVWLHETGTITFHYGPNTITDPALIAEGFLNSAGLVGNFDPYSYGGTLLVAEGG